MELDIDFSINFPVNLFSLIVLIILAIVLILKLSIVYSNFIMVKYAEIPEFRFQVLFFN